jgi:hypothetical protein
MNKQLLCAIVAYGDEYCRRYLAKYDASVLEADWWEAFDFFLSHACFQGRRDEVSIRVYQNAIEILKPLFSGHQADNNYQIHHGNQWENLSDQLSKTIGKGKVGKARDVDMIVNALSYIGSLPNKNLVAHSVAQVCQGKLSQHYNEIQFRNGAGITQVGPKIAAFYLRDLVSLFQLANLVNSSAAFCLQAVDTWVHKVATKLGIVAAGDNTENVQSAIVSFCEREGISPLRFNQGAWFTGYHAFEIVLELLSDENHS